MHACRLCGYELSESAEFCGQCGTKKGSLLEGYDASESIRDYAKQIHLLLTQYPDHDHAPTTLRLRDKLKISHAVHDHLWSSIQKSLAAFAHLADFKLEFNENMRDAYAGHDTYLEFKVHNTSQTELMAFHLFWDDPETPDEEDFHAETPRLLQPGEQAEFGGTHVFRRPGVKAISDLHVSVTNLIMEEGVFRASPIKFPIANPSQTVNNLVTTHAQISIEGRGVVDASGIGKQEKSEQTYSAKWVTLRCGQFLTDLEARCSTAEENLSEYRRFILDEQLKERIQKEETAKREAEAKARAEAEEKAHAEAEERAKRAAEAKARAEAEEQAKREAEAKARVEVEEQTNREVEAKARADEEEHAKREAKMKSSANAEEKTRQTSVNDARVDEEIYRKMSNRVNILDKNIPSTVLEEIENWATYHYDSDVFVSKSINYQDGSGFAGETLCGVPWGNGTLCRPSKSLNPEWKNDVYYGQFRNGEPYGIGEFTTEDGAIFVLKLSGSSDYIKASLMRLSSGYYYLGYLDENGDPDLYGAFISPEHPHFVYVGNILDGQLNGFVDVSSVKGSYKIHVYEYGASLGYADVINTIKDGSGFIYYGLISQLGIAQGYGVCFYFVNGNWAWIYEGTWSDGVPNGIGWLNYPNENINEAGFSERGVFFRNDPRGDVYLFLQWVCRHAYHDLYDTGCMFGKGQLYLADYPSIIIPGEARSLSENLGKLNDSISSYAQGVDLNSVIVFFDSSSFFGGKSGLIMTKSALFIKNSKSKSVSINFDEIESWHYEGENKRTYYLRIDTNNGNSVYIYPESIDSRFFRRLEFFTGVRAGGKYFGFAMDNFFCQGVVRRVSI